MAEESKNKLIPTDEVIDAKIVAALEEPLRKISEHDKSLADKAESSSVYDKTTVDSKVKALGDTVAEHVADNTRHISDSEREIWNNKPDSSEIYTRQQSDQIFASFSHEHTNDVWFVSVINAVKKSKADLVDGKVPASQLPPFDGDVLEYPSAAQFPAVGRTGRIYVAMDKNEMYRWNGSAYVKFFINGTFTGNGWALYPTENGGDGKWHKVIIANGALTYDSEGFDTPPGEEYAAQADLDAEVRRAVAAEALKADMSIVSTGSTTARNVNDRLADVVNVKDFGAVGDGVTNDKAAVVAAMKNNSRSVFLGYSGGEEYYGVDEKSMLYGSAKGSGAGSFLFGVKSSPTSLYKPIFMLNKYTSSSRTEGGREWDSGCLECNLSKIGGSTYASAMSAYAEYNGGTGDLIGIHARARGKHNNANIYAGWFYAYAGNGSGPSYDSNRGVHGIEIDVCNHNTTDSGWQESIGSPSHPWQVGLWVCSGLDSSTQPDTVGIGMMAGAQRFGFYTGYYCRKDTIVASSDQSGNTISNNEVFRLYGSTGGNSRYGGIRFGSSGLGNYLLYGISFVESSFKNNTAILLGPNQAIRFGEKPNAETGIFARSYGEEKPRLMIDGFDALMFGNARLGRKRIFDYGVISKVGDGTGWGSRSSFPDDHKLGLSRNSPLQDIASCLCSVVRVLLGHGILRNEVNVQFVPNGEGASCDEDWRTFATGTEIGATNPLPVPTWDGHEFVGWYDAASGGNEVTASTEFVASKRIYAHWK